MIRADPVRRGLLFAGTESDVRVSFDDGDHWQTLTLNMPDALCWDLTIKGHDLIVGTYGRGIWVLDDYSVLRQLAPGMETAPARLFAPADAVRVRRNVGSNTPLPPEVPHALNPPDGATLYYWLGAAPAGAITLEIEDATGQVVRHLSSAPIPPMAEIPRVPFPEYWLARPSGMPTTIGTNRINWDLRYDAPRVFGHDFEINANPGLTPASPEGPLALPGTYTVRLTVGGVRSEQKLVVRNDPTPASLATGIESSRGSRFSRSNDLVCWHSARPVRDRLPRRRRRYGRGLSRARHATRTRGRSQDVVARSEQLRARTRAVSA